MLQPEKGDGIIFGASSVDQVAPIIIDSYVYDRAHEFLGFVYSRYPGRKMRYQKPLFPL
jgi:hypothetical protein